MFQFRTGLSRFLTATGYYRKWWCISKLILIFIIKLGIWVIQACPNFIRGCPVFWQLLVTVENDVVSTRLIKIFIDEPAIWVILACPNFLRGCPVFWQLLVATENDDVSTNWYQYSIFIIKLGIWVIQACTNSYGIVTFIDSRRLSFVVMHWQLFCIA